MPTSDPSSKPPAGVPSEPSKQSGSPSTTPRSTSNPPWRTRPQRGEQLLREIVDYLKRCASLVGAPVQSGTLVTRVCRVDGGYEVTTNRGSWHCRTLVISSGACNIATVPALSANFPRPIVSMTPMEYRNPGQLPDDGVTR